ncbi:response regulator [Hymenobacter sp. HMF4947]|uniref:Response regulator n=1 Tax=Hymenobacter ginkgonis TaxID=2682976 RepID=A0A7K1TI61_9BACT|nr:response regulator [Hymenobacter ginkgonis]MVN78006.1 response regulator [Hymenobacter ginkgonis]
MQTILIDDDPTGVFLVKRLFQRAGLPDCLTTFLLPAEALAFLQQAPTEALPEVILLDLNMPLLSGWDVLEALKPQQEELKQRCSIYILTSSLAPADVARAKDNPLVVALLHKPLDYQKIQDIQARLRQ